MASNIASTIDSLLLTPLAYPDADRRKTLRQYKGTTDGDVIFILTYRRMGGHRSHWLRLTEHCSEEHRISLEERGEFLATKKYRDLPDYCTEVQRIIMGPSDSELADKTAKWDAEDALVAAAFEEGVRLAAAFSNLSLDEQVLSRRNSVNEPAWVGISSLLTAERLEEIKEQC